MSTLILTLQLEPEAQTYFEELRRLHFPPERNVVPAHLTLFHQLPHSDTVMVALKRAADDQPRFPLQVTKLRSLGRGVAYDLASPILMVLRERLAREFADVLIAQDRQRFQPHIVIQNKTSPEEAGALLLQLGQSSSPERVEARGLAVWGYLGGPWEHLANFAFPAQKNEAGSQRVG